MLCLVGKRSGTVFIIDSLSTTITTTMTTTMRSPRKGFFRLP